MSGEQAFLQQLQSDIHDDDTRLVYADWLEDHGEATKSRYLRSEIELARLREESPGYAEAFAEWRAADGEVDPNWVFQAGKRFDVVLRTYDPSKKISCIKVIRELAGVGLSEGKDLSEVLPSAVLCLLTRHQAEVGGARMRDATGVRFHSVEVVPSPRVVDQTGYASKVGDHYDLLLKSVPKGQEGATITAFCQVTGLPREEVSARVNGEWPFLSWIATFPTRQEAEDRLAAFPAAVRIVIRTYQPNLAILAQPLPPPGS